MATGFSVMDALNKNTKAGVEDTSPKGKFRTKDLSIFKIYANESNFYPQEDIEQKAGEILALGLLENLVVKYEPIEGVGEYKLISGERRWRGLNLLVERGYKEFEFATCNIIAPSSTQEEKVALIIANSQRSKSIETTIREEQELKETLEDMKANGVELKGYNLQSGRLRDIIADMLNVSKTKVAQIEAVSNNLIPEFMEELNQKRLTFSAAYELSGMSKDEQREALGVFIDTGELTYQTIKEMKEKRAKEAAGAQIEGQMSIDGTQPEQKEETEQPERIEPSKEEIRMLYDYLNYGVDRQSAEELRNEYGKRYSYRGSTELEIQCTPRGIAINKSDEITWKKAVSLLEELRQAEERILCHTCSQYEKCTRADKGTSESCGTYFAYHKNRNAAAGEEYQAPHPDGITSLCYSCVNYETCNVKTGTCTSCDQYKNRAEAYKTEEQRYSEEQDAIDRETQKRLREQKEREEAGNQTQENSDSKIIRVSPDMMREIVVDHTRPYMILKNAGYKVGDVLKLLEFKDARVTGEAADMRITCMDDENSSTAIDWGYCIVGLAHVQCSEEEAAGE